MTQGINTDSLGFTDEELDRLAAVAIARGISASALIEEYVAAGLASARHHSPCGGAVH